ncbi:hypothetical protein DDB_G0277237 [Dictyostelium discoideum AX4]|uniref:Uncharacterized protein n=1 Tax=Dictyostelium discoideum TaxID=44689 RepID=Q86K54_DICDI|nr:hypothetical protein DDB_G0277237 [Dictyostelium discoideum AX4]EAL68804.1 hypothetical protein DDB_G0277237 [Dictyostelium discoideum AX4]|eukprot:XP_642737.1 hypothetical protein DDB_G0277237 [Dictyostelium discoideum AX4]
MIIISLILMTIKLFFFATPLVGLVASSIFLDYRSTLRISLVLLICQLISLLVQSLFVKGGIEKWNFIKFIIDIPILALSYYIYPLIPDQVIDFYYYCFQWIFPLLVYTVESYQAILLIVFKSRSLSNQLISSDSNNIIFKTFVILISIFSYSLSFFIIYQIFNYNIISTLNSCLLSSLGTLMILLLPYMYMVEESMLSDISLITLTICLNLYSFFFQFDTSSIINTVNILKSLSYLVTFILISYPIINNKLDSDSTDQFINGDDDDESVLLKLKSKIFHIGLVIALTYLPLSMTNIVSNGNLVFRYLQGVFTVLCYFALLSQSNSDPFKFKYD